MELGRLAITLYFYSPKAYRFVDDEFKCVFPCQRSLGKWYVHVDAEQGLTKEDIDTRFPWFVRILSLRFTTR